MYETFIANFTNDDELTPIDIVIDITGLSYEEIMTSDKFEKVQVDDESCLDDPKWY